MSSPARRVNPELVDYNGQMVTPITKELSIHVVDQMNDHFGNGQDSSATFIVDDMISFPYDERYRGKGEEPGDRWWAEVNLAYTVASGTTAPFHAMGVDNVILDLTKRMKKDGTLLVTMELPG